MVGRMSCVAAGDDIEVNVWQALSGGWPPYRDILTSIKATIRIILIRSEGGSMLFLSSLRSVPLGSCQTGNVC